MSEFDLQRRAKIFKSLCDPTRLQIVEALAQDQEITGKDLAENLGITLALLCHHTSTLEEAGIVIKRKQGQSCYHRLNRHALDVCLASLGQGAKTIPQTTETA